MQKMRKPLALFLGLILCISLLAACGQSTPSVTASASGSPAASASASMAAGSADPLAAPPPKGAKLADTVTYITADAVATINSHSPTGDGSSHNNACRMIYDTLYYNQPDGKSTPMLATSYDTKDNQTWVFHLRKDVTFHNGDKFTAKDVVFTWQHAIDAKGSIAATNWGYITEATVVDDYTVQFKTATPYSGLLFNIGIDVAGILNEKAIKADEVKGFWVGTGAYKLSELSPNDHMTFERNDNYWGEKALTKTQIWKYIPEASSRAVMLQNGSAQLGTVSSTDLDMFRKDPKFGVNVGASNNAMALMFNMADPVCGDLNFRKAVASAISKEELATFAMGDLALPVKDGTIWGYEVPFKNTDIKPITQDLDKAKEFLKQSSYKGQEIELTVMSGSDQLSQGVQAELGAIGVKIKINMMDVPSFMAYTGTNNNKSQMNIFFTMMSQNPVDTYRINFYPTGSTNKMSYNNPEVTKLLDQAPSVMGDDAQKQLYYKMQELVTADIPCIPLTWMAGALVYQKGLGGMLSSPSAHTDMRYMYVAVQ
jgi:peptide/nickel transport system substrate-binding protein